MNREYKQQRLKEVEKYIEDKKKKEKRKESIINFVIVITLAMFVIATIIIFLSYLGYKYMHPELTQTQLELWVKDNFNGYGILVMLSAISTFYIKFKW